jgi:hypothetical protein
MHVCSMLCPVYTVPHLLLQRRVLLPGSMFPINLLGQALPLRSSFCNMTFKYLCEGGSAVIKVSAVVSDFGFSSSIAVAAASTRTELSCEEQAAMVGSFTVFNVRGCIHIGTTLRIACLIIEIRFHLMQSNALGRLHYRNS